MRVVLMRNGSTVLPKAGDSTGHEAEMWALIKHLHENYELAVFGRCQQEVPCKHINLEVKSYSDPNTDDSIEAHAAEYDRMCEELKEFDPQAFVTVMGPSATACVPGNGRRVQSFAARYNAPIVKAWTACKDVPRICTLNDPRNILRLRECAQNNVWPQAMLSQTEENRPIEVSGVSLRRVYTYAKIQNWGLGEIDVPDGPCGEGGGILAHSHFADGRVGRNRKLVWDYILGFLNQQPEIHGKGWGDDIEPLKGNEVNAFLRRIKYGPLIPIAEGWITAKYGQYIRNGAIPLCYDAGGFLTYDEQGLAVPSAYRWNPGEAFDWSRAENAWHQAVKDTEPDFSVLDQCLQDAFDRPEWFGSTECTQRYGGYHAV